MFLVDLSYKHTMTACNKSRYNRNGRILNPALSSRQIGIVVLTLKRLGRSLKRVRT